MEAFISAILGEIVSRAISMVIHKCHEQTTAKEQTTTEEDLQRMHQLLLRIYVVVEEAEGRCVTNRGMIHQITNLKEQMFRGYFLLDAFKCREKKTEDKEVSLARSKFNPAKRIRLLTSNTQYESMIIGRDISKELKQVILVLENMVTDMNEFAIFLMSYPRIYRQPYGAYLYLDKYMFGRQLEREQAVSFLLHAEPPGNGNFGVLPIVGPALVGKSTFVEHICNDERVRNHFSLISIYRRKDLEYEKVKGFRDDCVIKHQNTALGEKRMLVVIELLGDVDNRAWKMLLHSAKTYMTHGSKIIITSRSEKMASVGTTETIKLNYLSKEAYWHFFKMLVFGSTDPEEHPALTCIAMELSLEMRGSFLYANCHAAVLKQNLSAWFWCRVLKHFREYRQRNTLLFGKYPEDDHMPRYVWTVSETKQAPEQSKSFLLDGRYQKELGAGGDDPRKTLVDIVSKSQNPVPQGKFEILFWRSLITPYYSYMNACEFVQPKITTP